MDLHAKSIVFVLGAPGSGKGTLCKKLSDEYGFKHLSVGDILREIAVSPDADKDFIDCLQRGELVPVEVLGPILQSRIEKASQMGSRKILVDGFPRCSAQAAAIEAMIGSPVLVLYFDCPKNLAQERFLARKLAGREKDDERMFEKRYREFSALNPSIIEHYQTRHLILEVDTSGQTEVSFQKLVDTLKNTVKCGSLVGA